MFQKQARNQCQPMSNNGGGAHMFALSTTPQCGTATLDFFYRGIPAAFRGH